MSAMSRRHFMGGAIAASVGGIAFSSSVFGITRGVGDIRRVRMVCVRTGEAVDMIYWIDGEYISGALHEINHFMRDWRLDVTKEIDVRTIDIIAATQKLLDTTEAFQLMSGYRTVKTNDMLRKNSRGVARNSLHIQGKAADLRLYSRSTRQVANAARTLRAGGVGRYANSGFVHLDCGVVRLWRG